MIEQDYNHIRNLKAALREKFGDIVFGLYCFGSRITLNKQDADFDIVVVTHEVLDWKRKREIAHVVLDYGIEHDIVFDVKIFSMIELNDTYSIMPFIQNVKKTGVFV